MNFLVIIASPLIIQYLKKKQDEERRLIASQSYFQPLSSPLLVVFGYWNTLAMIYQLFSGSK